MERNKNEKFYHQVKGLHNSSPFLRLVGSNAGRVDDSKKASAIGLNIDLCSAMRGEFKLLLHRSNGYLSSSH